jgi:hypothetical protein
MFPQLRLQFLEAPIPKEHRGPKYDMFRKRLLRVLDPKSDGQQPLMPAQPANTAPWEMVVSPHARKVDRLGGYGKLCEWITHVDAIEPSAAGLFKNIHKLPAAKNPKSNLMVDNLTDIRSHANQDTYFASRVSAR